MPYFPFNFLTLFGSIIIFLLFGFFLSILLFPKYLKKKVLRRQYFDLIAMIIGLSITTNILLGYILDIFLNIAWYSHLSSLLLLSVITFYYRKDFFLKPRDKMKFILKNLIGNGKKTLKSIHFYLFFIILLLYFLNIFNYSFYFFSVPSTDPTHIMKIITHSLFTEKVTYNDAYVGFLKWEDTHYPMGFIIVLYFLSCYDPSNLFILIKFFGPFINLLSLTCIYFISLKITKNKIAGLIAMLTYISSGFINDFSTLTVGSGLGILLFFLSLSFLIEKSITSSRISGILLGGGFLVHPFAGAAFYLPGICLYFIIRYIRKKERNGLFFFLTMFIILIPYILLYRYPGFSSKVGNVINNSSQMSNSLIEYELLFWGPSMIFYIIIFFSIFSFNQYKEELLLFLGIFIISLLFILNPFIINGVPLKNILDQFYHHARGLFFFSISCAYLSSLGIVGLQNLFKFFKQKYYQFLRVSSFKIRMDNRVINISLILLISSQLITTTNHFSQGYGFFWPHKIPGEYTEVLLWINENIKKDSSIIAPNNTFNLNNEALIECYHNALVFQYKIERNNTYFQKFNFTKEYLKEIGFFSHDYLILPQEYIQYYDNIIANQSIVLTFSSYLKSYSLYKMSKNPI